MMEKKSVAPFVLGLIGAILAMVGALCVSVCAEALGELSKEAGGEDISIWFHLGTWGPAVLALVGSIVYNKQSKLGGALMLASGILLVVTVIFFWNILGIISGVLLVIGGAIGLAQKQ
jgi:hypothetical protein